MDEQNSDGRQSGFWESWTASPRECSEPEPAQASTPDDHNADPGAPADPGQAEDSERAAFTQPVGYPQPGYGYPPPGYPQAGSGQGQPGGDFGPAPGGGYGPPPGGGYGQPSGGGYGQPPGGGYGLPGGGYGQPPRPRRRGLTTAITYIAVAAMAATAGGLVVAFADSGTHQPSANSGTFGNGFGNNNPFNGGNGAGRTPGASIGQGTQQKVVNDVKPGIVVITSNLQYRGSGAAAAATGMIISPNGLVLTNNHVINGTTGLTATVAATHRQYKARWLGYDKGSDIAVIQLVGASGLRAVPLGDSSSVNVGDSVIGMGNAGGTGNIVAVPGTVTGLDQTITASDGGDGVAPERLTGMIQTDANIIPGDSGGPLASTAGKVIGMDTAASTNGITSNQQNVGFAIPINKALTIARQIIAGRQGAGVQIGPSGFVGVLVPSGRNGAQSTATSPTVQLQQQQANEQQLGQATPAPSGCLQSNASPGVPTRIAPVSSGTLVLGALCQTPAATVGLIAGDVIIKVDNHQVSSPASLMKILKGVRGGSTVSLTWVTPSDQTVTRAMTLDSAPPQ